MDFFTAQDRARRSTRWLIAAYVVSTLLIIAGVTAIVGAALYMSGEVGTPAHPSVLIATAILAALLIGGATLYKTAVLSAGGGRVATDMGGTLVPADVQDPLRRRLRNVVEEMAIASGIPAPEVYVLEAEQGINAFAAGLSTGDAAIAVTRGALELLDRDELQGVIAHEFSHVLNGDMRINVRMIGVLFGIMVLAIIGRMILRGGYYSRGLTSRRNRNAPFVLAIGAGLTVLGWLGVLFARLIKAGVSRQRETLADASAVQFTRQTEGLAGALKKIGGYSGHSWFQAADPEEVSHMLFASGRRRIARLFATHPPLIERIRVLDPSFRPEDYPKVERPPATAAEDQPGPAAAFAGEPDRAARGAAVADLAGNPQPEHVVLAQRLRRAIPVPLYDAAHSLDEALLLTVALVLHPDERQRERQLNLAAEQMGARRAARIRRYDEALREAGRDAYLPLLDITFPALRRRPAAQLEFLVGLLERLVGLDEHVDLREYCFMRIVTGSIGVDRAFARPAGIARATRADVRDAAVLLLRLAARQEGEPGADVAAFRAGLQTLGLAADDYPFESDTRAGVAELDRSLGVLRRLRARDRRRLVESLSVTLLSDERLAPGEAGLLRAVCAVLDCPLPPLEHLPG